MRSKLFKRSIWYRAFRTLRDVRQAPSPPDFTSLSELFRTDSTIETFASPLAAYLHVQTGLHVLLKILLNSLPPLPFSSLLAFVDDRIGSIGMHIEVRGGA